MSAEPIDPSREQSAELSELAGELADVRRRLLEAEQQLAELPGLRLRSERLEEIESSPLLGPLTRTRERAEMRAGETARGARRDLKRLIAGLVERISPSPDRDQPDRDE